MVRSARPGTSIHSRTSASPDDSLVLADGVPRCGYGNSRRRGVCGACERTRLPSFSVPPGPFTSASSSSAFGSGAPAVASIAAAAAACGSGGAGESELLDLLRRRGDCDVSLRGVLSAIPSSDAPRRLRLLATRVAEGNARLGAMAGGGGDGGGGGGGDSPPPRAPSPPVWRVDDDDDDAAALGEAAAAAAAVEEEEAVWRRSFPAITRAPNTGTLSGFGG